MTVKIMARLTLMNHRLSVHPARLFRILRLESVPEVEEDLENTASALPHKYCNKEIDNIEILLKHIQKNINCLVSGHDYDGNGSLLVSWPCYSGNIFTTTVGRETAI